jgi:excisionase family DNA binding protein
MNAAERRALAAPGDGTFKLLQPGRGEKRLPKGRYVVVLDVAEEVVRGRVVGTAAAAARPPELTEAEARVLAAGGGRSIPEAQVSAGALLANAYSEILESALSVDQAAERLGVNGSRVRQRLADRSLYGIKHGGGWRLPAFQFGKRGLVPGLDEVLPALPKDLNVVAVVRWFGTPNPDLCTRDQDERPLTPLEWLAQGHAPQAAAELARDL